MILSSSYGVRVVLLLSTFGLAANAGSTINYDWNVTWVTANPDGLAERPTMGINGKWPLPQLNLTTGDRVIATVHNQLGNESTSIHFHGIFQSGTNSMDGPVGVTQCDIAPGSTMVYNFTIQQSGTYWYHSHSRGQYPDGLRQMIVVKDPDDPLAGQYDAEVTFTLSDWYHDQMPSLIASFLNLDNPTGAEPVPNSALMNDTQNLTVPIEAGKTYLFHVANVGAFAGHYFWIEDHVMRLVEIDGVNVNTADATMIYITAAQRYSFLVTAQNSSGTNFAMMSSMDTTLFDSLPDSLNWNVTGWLVYNDSAPKPAAAVLQAFDPFDDFNLVPTDGLELYDQVDHSIQLNLSMINLDNGANYAAFNNVPYVTPKVPTLYSVMSSGSVADNVSIYGTNTNSFVLTKGQIVEIIVNNQDSGKHPFHLHGHNFQTVARAPEDAGDYDASRIGKLPEIPARRDTFMVLPTSYIILRFKADNPGVWLFHCHIQFHMDSGLVATMIEAPLELQETLQIPADHYQVCKASNTLTAGNAAGDTKNLFDLSRENKNPGYLPAGFTARGIVALVFSVLSAFLGMAAIAWYGIKPLSSDSQLVIGGPKRFGSGLVVAG